MPHKRFSYISLSIIILLIMHTATYAVSPSMKSQNDYRFTLDTLRTMRIIIENFASEEQQNEYNEIKALFQSASEEYYAQNFTSSHQKFFKVKTELLNMIDTIAQQYMERTKEILDSTSKNSFDILIQYSKGSGLAKYFYKPYNPLEDIKVYDEKKYHFFHDRVKIESYLKNGYKRLQDAKNIYSNDDLNYIKNKKGRTHKHLELLITRYIDIIEHCRQAKQYGIEIHKILNVHQVVEIQRKYGLKGNTLEPIFDDRIPEEYKVDANDNLSLIHSIEKSRLEKRKEQQ